MPYVSQTLKDSTDDTHAAGRENPIVIDVDVLTTDVRLMLTAVFVGVIVMMSLSYDSNPRWPTTRSE